MAEPGFERRPQASFGWRGDSWLDVGGSALPQHPRASITLAPQMQRWIFRGDAEAARVCGSAFGADLPQTACRASDSGGRAALWLGPDEWLLLCGEDTAFGQSQIAPAHSLVDISHRQLGIDISGEAAAQILSTRIILDLDAQAFPAGACTRTVFGKSEVVLWRKGDHRFQIEVWRSFAGYVTGLLMEAARDTR